MNPTNAAEAVANGAQLLDEKMPGWWRNINLRVLDISSCSACICGQLAAVSLFETQYDHRYSRPDDRRFVQFAESLGVSKFWTHGFAKENGVTSFKELDAEWEKVIRARLEADQLPASTDEREDAHVATHAHVGC